jgi:hypothetical protein
LAGGCWVTHLWPQQNSWHSDCSSILLSRQQNKKGPNWHILLDPQSSLWGPHEDMMRTTPTFSCKLDTRHGNETTTRQDETSTVTFKKLSDQVLLCQRLIALIPRLECA